MRLTTHRMSEASETNVAPPNAEVDGVNLEEDIALTACTELEAGEEARLGRQERGRSGKGMSGSHVANVAHQNDFLGFLELLNDCKRCR